MEKSDYQISLYDADIHWYLALAYIKSNKLKDAINECEYIISKHPDSSYVSSAHTLIDKIKAIPFISSKLPKIEESWCSLEVS